jgi:transcriptional regulator with XRE-family HTH domain
LREKGISKKELAVKLEKHPSEISKWLNGEHNFTLRSIAKLQSELGETLLEVPSKKPTATLYSPFRKASYRLTVKRNPITVKGKKEDWKNANAQNEYANVG